MNFFRPSDTPGAILQHFVKVGKPLEHDDFDLTWERTVKDVAEVTCKRFEANIDSYSRVQETTASEVSEAINTLKRKKAAGFEEVTTEHLIEADGVASCEIARCLEELLLTASIPRNLTLA